jgi:glycosyltransferase involved in cell wall biosynthesis
MAPLVSIVMPAWRPRRDWLVEAVTAATTGETVDLEVIVVDDGSPEPVADLLDGIDDERVRTIRCEHRGPYASRDAGLESATGAYIRFLDADDVSVAGSTTRLVTALQGRSDHITYGVTEVCNEALVPRAVAGSEITGPAAAACLLGNFDVYHVSMLFPRGVVGAAGTWAESRLEISGDWDFVLRTLDHANVQPVGEVVTRYRRHAGSVMSSATVEAGARARAAIIERYFQRHPDQRGSRLRRHALAALHLDRAEAHAWSGDRRAAFRHLVQGVRHRPIAGARTAAGLLVERVRVGAGEPA